MTIPRHRVLVVEDIPTRRRAYASVLERHGYEVSVARNGGAALAVLGVVRPDVVVAEVAMPVMDGLALLHSLRERGTPAPVLMLADDEFLRGLALHCGAEEFLAQPISSQALLDAVGRLAGRVRPSPAGRRDSA